MSTINKTSDAISGYLPRWQKIRDFLEGSYAVKYKGLEYLPLAARGQDHLAYETYKNEVTFYPASERTLSGLHGLIFSKKPVMTAPNNIIKIAEAASYEGKSIYDIAEWMVRETISVTYGGVLVDYPSTATPASQGDAEKRNFRPRFATYPAESVIRVEREFSETHNEMILSYVELRQDANTNRVLKLVDGVYTMETWRKSESGYSLIRSVQPKRGTSETLDEIPFEVLTDEAGEVDPRKPFLEDVVSLNHDHYRTEGRITYIHYWQSMAILYVTGADATAEELLKDAEGVIVTDENGKPVKANGFSIGGPDAWVLSNPQGKVDYAEFSGTGVEALERKLSKIEDRIAKVGAQVLGSEKKDAEAVEVVAMRRQAESSTLAAVARVVSRKVTNLLQWAEWWEGADENNLKSSFQLNTDYRVTDMSPQLLTVLAQDSARGELSSKTYFDLRQHGGIIPETLTWEEELERREEDTLRVPVNDFTTEDLTPDDEE